jgi:molybdopterin converting factor small subunit
MSSAESVQQIEGLINELVVQLGQVDAKQFAKSVIFGKDTEQMDSFHTRIATGFPILNKNFDSFLEETNKFFVKTKSKFSNASKNLNDNFDEDDVKKVFSDPFGTKKIKEARKNLTSEYKSKTKEIRDKIKNLDINLDDKEVANAIRNSLQGSVATSSNIPKSALGLQQANLESSNTIIDFSSDTKNFLSDLLLKKFKLQKGYGISADGGFGKMGSKEFKNSGNPFIQGLEGGLAANALKAIGLEGLVSSFSGLITAVLGITGSLLILDKIAAGPLNNVFKKLVENTVGVDNILYHHLQQVKDEENPQKNALTDVFRGGFRMFFGNTAANADQKLTSRFLAENAKFVAKTNLGYKQEAYKSLLNNVGDKKISKLTVEETKELASLEKEIADLKKIAFPELEVGTKFLKETAPVTKSLYGVMKGFFNGTLLTKAFGPSAAKIGGKLFGTSLKALKLLPGIGALVSAYFAWDRFEKRDYIGSFLESIIAISDILSIVTSPSGVGLVAFEAISVGAIVLEAILDWNGVTGKDYNKLENKKGLNFKISQVFDGIGKMLSKSKFISALLNGFSSISKLITSINDGDVGGIASSLQGLSMFPALFGLASDIMNITGLDATPQYQQNAPNKIPSLKAYKSKQKELYDYNLAYGENGGKKEEREKLQDELSKLKASLGKDQQTDDNSNQINDNLNISPMADRKLIMNGKTYDINDGDTITMLPYGGINNEFKQFRETLLSMHRAYMTTISKLENNNNTSNNISSVNIASSSGSKQPPRNYIINLKDEQNLRGLNLRGAIV